jgi:hypothetical protein
MKKKVKKEKKRNPRSLVIQKLENVSKEVFRKHYDLITRLVGSSPGIYCLYDTSELYYVGKSTYLRRRVKHHLRNRHLASWTHFSLYLVRKAEHIDEIESLLVRIANPEGNRRVPKGKVGSAMLKQLKALVKQKQVEEFADMFGSAKLTRQKAQKGLKKHPKTLKGLIIRRTPLYKTYKGKEYRAFLYPSGTIKIGAKSFKSPTAAALFIVKRPTVNGWTFWYIKGKRGEWVRLSEYKR